jgi:hypothetical protein
VKPTFQDQVHFMSRQAELLDEQGNDVSAKVMREAMDMLVAENARAERVSAALKQVYRDLSSRVRVVHDRSGTPIVNKITEALHDQ